MTRGFEVFRGTLAQFAAVPRIRQSLSGRRIQEVADRAAQPLRIAVRGRPGVGVTSVIAALERALPADEGAGHVLVEASVSDADPASDVDVVVIAESLKPEDRSALAESTVPRVLVLNKADLSDSGTARGPWTAALQRCAQYQAETGVPAFPLSAHVPLVAVDTDIVDALRKMVDEPADTSSVDAFVTTSHAVPVAMRRRLLRELDLYPMGCAIGALKQAPELGAVALTSLLHDLSGIDAVAGAIRAAAAQGWYRRMRSVLFEMRRIGVTGDLPVHVDTFLDGDDLVLAAMGCAVDAVAAAGIPVDSADLPDEHRIQAMRWQRFASGPVTGLYAAMGTDIYRGSLRLWRRAGGRA